MNREERKRSEAEIRGYLESQLPGQEVHHLECVGVEHVAGVRHEIWDAHTDGDRWWVVTNPTNLYTQTDFKSRDVVLTFHVGLAVRVMSRHQASIVGDAREIFGPVWRRWGQAAEALSIAEEAEDFQAVGTHLRECLISFAHEIESEQLATTQAERPKSSDVIGWSDLFAESIAPGSSNARLRRYLKALVEPTWDYQQHLLHNKNAARLDAEIGCQAVAHLLASFTAALLRSQGEYPRCGECDAYAVTGGTCRRCGWRDPDYEPPSIPARSAEDIEAGLAEPCTPSSDIATFIRVDDVD